MRILLTGSSGFIGNCLVDALANEGHQVVGFDREEPGWCQPHEFIHADLMEEKPLAEALSGVDCVFHLAAAKDDWGISSEEYFRDNAEATRRLIEIGAEQGVTRWFHYSTVGVLPRGSEPLAEDASFQPETEYGASKARAEELFRELADRDATVRIMMLRPSAVFGPRNPPTTNVHRLIEAILAGRFVMVGDGQTPKTTSYIENLLEATLFLFDRMERGLQVFHYVDEPVMTTDYLVATIYRALDERRPGWRVPLNLAKPVANLSDIAAAVLGVDFPITAARIEKFCTPTNFSARGIRELGFRQPVANQEAVVRTVEWHVARAGR